MTLAWNFWASLLEYLPKVHEGKWKKAFLPMVSKSVRVCVDLAVIRNHQVLMKWRKDEFWEGWECPGGSLGPGETWKDAAERFGKEEFGMRVRFLKEIGTFSNTDNSRAHDVTVLLLCAHLDLEEPSDCEWFSSCPPGLIGVHQKYWPAIASHLDYL